MLLKGTIKKKILKKLFYLCSCLVAQIALILDYFNSHISIGSYISTFCY